MIQTITVINHKGKEWDLELTNPYPTGLIVESVEGLGPGTSTINVTEVATMDGGVFNSSRASTRNIVLNLKFLDDYKNEKINSIEKIRHITYEMFPLKKTVTLYFATDERKCHISGYVESNEPDIWSDQEGCSVSIICPNPYFIGDDTVDEISNLSIYHGAFYFCPEEYEYANEGDEPNTVFGTANDSLEFEFDYQGEADAGMTMEMVIKGSINNFTVRNKVTREFITLNYSFSSGEVLKICTIKGQKSIRVYKSDGTYANILNYMVSGSKWFQLTSGLNSYEVLINSGFIGDVTVNVSHTTYFEGV